MASEPGDPGSPDVRRKHELAEFVEQHVGVNEASHVVLGPLDEDLLVDHSPLVRVVEVIAELGIAPSDMEGQRDPPGDSRAVVEVLR